MWRADSRRSATAAVVAMAALTAGCSGSLVHANRHPSSGTTTVLRVAVERGLTDVSTATSTIFEIPVEVRSGPDTVRLPGCALQAFRLQDVRGGAFSIDDAVADPDIQRSVVPAADSVVAPGQSRLVTLRLTATRIPQDPETGRDAESLGVRVDGTSQATEGTSGCPDARTVGPGVQHFGLERLEVKPIGLGAMAAVGMVITILALSGR